MVKQKSRYDKARNIFLALFLVSTCLALFFGFFSVPTPSALAPGDAGQDILTIAGVVATGASCLTSMVTLIGFVSTTVLAWRKEARDKEDRELERMRQEIELEKERLELEMLRAKQKKR